MTFFRSLLVLCPAACLLAQTPPPAAAPPAPKPAAAAPANATPVPKPTVTFSAENPADKVMPTVPPDKVVLTVGEVSLTAAQFDQVIEALPEQYRPVARGAGRKQFADNLVKVLVLSQEGKRRKLDETATFKTLVMFQTANALAAATYADIGKQIQVSDADLHKYYQDHIGEYEQVRARHILIRFTGSPLPLKPGQKDLTEAEALAKAQDLEKQIKAGADFGQLAKKESDDTGSAANEGDLNFFHRGQMVPSFDAAAFALQPGQVSEPVKSQFGYHIIKVEAKQTKTFDEAKADIEKHLKPEESQKALEDLQKKSAVVYDPVFFDMAKK
jgi:peptidyl-prolyl cis-trans isomerase C